MSDDTRRIAAFALTEYTPRGSSETKTRWTKIGAAFENDDSKDGEPGSITVQLDAVPVSGRLQLRWETDTDIRERQDRERKRSGDRRSGGRR